MTSKRNPVLCGLARFRRLAYQGQSGLGAALLVCKTIHWYQPAANSPLSDELEKNMQDLLLAEEQDG